MRILLACQALLVLCVFVVLVTLWWPVCWCDEKHCLEVLVISGALCLAPGLVVLAIPLVIVDSRFVGLAVLLGGVFRLLAVLIGLLVMVLGRPDVPPMLFGWCLVTIYFACLVVETVVALRLLAMKYRGGESVFCSGVTV